MSDDAPSEYPFPRTVAAGAAPWVVAQRASVRPASFGSAQNPSPVIERRANGGRPSVATYSSPPSALPPPPPSPPSSLLHGTPPPGSHSVLPAPSTLGEELAQELTVHIEAYAQAAIELAAAREKTLQRIEGDLLSLAVDIAEALVDAELERRPELHLRLARAALGCLRSVEGAQLRASPRGFEAITDASGGSTIVHDGVDVRVVLDASLEGLGCVVDDDMRRVDGRVAERLDAVRRALADERRDVQREVG